MKVLIAIPCILQGGTEMQTLSLTKALRSCDHTVILVCYFEYQDSVVREFQKTGATVRLLNMNRELVFTEFILRLRKVIRSIRPNVVHVQYMAPGALPIIAARLAKIRTVFATVHQPYTKSHRRLSKSILMAASLLTTRFMAVSKNAEESWFGSSSLFNEKIPLKSQPNHFTIYNSIDATRIWQIVKRTDHESLRKKIEIPAGSILIGLVSRFRHEKGIDLLIEAFKLLISEQFSVHLLIVGTGPDKEKLENQVSSFNLSQRVTFYGEADWETAIRLTSVMDIVVVPSRFEGFGLFAAEGMAAGKPIVASDSYGLKEVVIDNVTGFRFGIGDSAGLAEKLKELILNPGLRRQYGIAGQERVKSMFDTEVFLKKITALYDSFCI